MLLYAGGSRHALGHQPGRPPYGDPLGLGRYILFRSAVWSGGGVTPPLCYRIFRAYPGGCAPRTDRRSSLALADYRHRTQFGARSSLEGPSCYMWFLAEGDKDARVRSLAQH